MLSDLKDTWLQRESCSSSSETFYDWFMKYKAEVFCTSTLQPLREAAGLGKPPIGYFTNPNESINSALKKKTNYKKQELAVFINLMIDFVTQQQEEVEKAVIGGGKYTLDTPYKGYEVTDGSWFRPMTESRRKAHLKKFNSLKLCSNNYVQGNSETDNSPSNSLGATLSAAMQYLQLSESIVMGIWVMAQALLADPTAISFVPGGSGKDKFVLSRSGTVPHLVKHTSKCDKCGDQCMSFKSNGICSHVVAVSERNGDLDFYLCNYKQAQSKKPINLFQAAKHDMPSGAGCKVENLIV